MSFGPTPRFPLVEKYQRPDDQFIVISGSCSVESREQIDNIAAIVKKQGATHLRGGVFRAGTYPGKSFGWVSEELIQDFYLAAKTNGLKNIIEVLDYSDESLEMISKYCDCFQVGARSMQNYSLLRKLGQYGKPVFLKRNTGSTLNEWLGAAEHLLTGGVKELYLIERGSSTFENHVRWGLSVSMIAGVKSLTQIPVIVDASHASGRRDFVEALTLAGVAAGADGLLVEVHQIPEESLSDAEQAITPHQFYNLMKKVNKLREAIK